MPNAQVQPTPEQPKYPILNILLGILFLIPAVLACAASQLALSVGTVITSLQKSHLTSSAGFIGLQNYAQLFKASALGGAISFTASTMLVRILAVILFPLLLGWGASRFRSGLRIGLKLLFTIPVAAFFPLALAVLWALLLRPAAGSARPSLLTNPAQARMTLLGLDFIYTLGLACGVGLVFTLAASRNPQAELEEASPGCMGDRPAGSGC